MSTTEFPKVKAGELIKPRMAAAGGYLQRCCDCGLTHRLDFSISRENGLELRVYRVEPSAEDE